MKSRPKKHFWIDLIVVVAGIACGLALLIASLGAAAGAASGDAETAQTITLRGVAPQNVTPQLVTAQSDATPTSALHIVSEQAAAPQAGATQGDGQQTYEGIVTCSTCGAKHSAKIGKNASDCARMCVHGGASFALVDGEKIYLLNGDAEMLKRLAGQRAQIVGAMHGNIITVATIVAST
jgi:hypothetical protein